MVSSKKFDKGNPKGGFALLYQAGIDAQKS